MSVCRPLKCSKYCIHNYDKAQLSPCCSVIAFVLFLTTI